MTGERPLGELLADAPAQLAIMEARAAERPPIPEADALAIIRTAALLHNLDSEKIVADFERGGPLADLVRAVVGTVAARTDTATRGRPYSYKVMESIAWYQNFIDTGLSQGSAIQQTAAKFKTDVGTMRQRVKD